MNGQSFTTTIRQQFNIFLGALMFMTRIPVGKGYVFRSGGLAALGRLLPAGGSDDWLAGGCALVRRPIFCRWSLSFSVWVQL